MFLHVGACTYRTAFTHKYITQGWFTLRSFTRRYPLQTRNFIFRHNQDETHVKVLRAKSQFPQFFCSKRLQCKGSTQNHPNTKICNFTSRLTTEPCKFSICRFLRHLKTSFFSFWKFFLKSTFFLAFILNSLSCLHFFAVGWSLCSPVQKIWKHFLTSKALRLWGWDWVQESKLKESRFMFDIIVKLNFENENNEWWCLTKYPEMVRNEKKWTFRSDPKRNELSERKKMKKTNRFFCFSFFFVVL